VCNVAWIIYRTTRNAAVCWSILRRVLGPERAAPVPPFLEGAEITLEMSYSCPSNTACSFACPSGVGRGGADAAAGSGAAGGPGTAGGLGVAGGPGATEGLGVVGGFFGADHVTKLTIYLGTISFGNRDAPVLFYVFSTRERPNSSGFSINAGLSATSCQVNGLTPEYYGRPLRSSGTEPSHK